jgi:RNA polymerase sigma-70 factor (ECF subfamily)
MKVHPSSEFESRFREYFRPLTVFAMQFVKDQAAAEDIVQDVFLYLYDKRSSKGIQKLDPGFLYKMVRYRSLNFIEYQNLRKGHKEKTIPEYTENPHDPIELIQQIELENAYLQALTELSPKCREVFELSRREGMKNSDISEQLGISKRTVETHISNALKILRKKLVVFLRVMLFLTV